MFNGARNMPRLLEENFSELYFVRDRAVVRQSFIDELKLNLVIVEIVEKFLNDYPSLTHSFVQTPLKEFKCEIMGYKWNGNKVTVRVKNTGKETWKYIDQVKLGLFSNGKDTNIRSLTPAKQEIKPGQLATFTISVAKNPRLLNTRLSVGMVQEGVKCFTQQKIIK